MFAGVFEHTTNPMCILGRIAVDVTSLISVVWVDYPSENLSVEYFNFGDVFEEWIWVIVVATLSSSS